MGYMPIPKLLLTMSAPMIVSMLVQALYNIVDSIFVARISENALTAVSMAFPIQNLMIAVGVGTAVGVNALLARSLGEKDFEKVNKVATNAVFLVGMSYLVFLIIGLFFVEPFFRSQTDIEEIIQYGKQYLTVCSCVSLGIFTQMMFERMLQATGKTMLSMYTQLIGAITNLILDPILIFGMFGIPAMGITGAAVATVVGQLAAGVAAVMFNHKKNPEVQIHLKGFRPDGDIIKQIYTIAVPSIIMQSIGSIMNYGMNRILISFTSTATAVFGVYFKLQSFIFMPVFGLNNGIIPIIAYNYGAGKRERVIKTMKKAALYAVSILTVGMVLFQIFPVPFLKMFDASETMLAIGVPALRIISLSFPLAGACIAMGSSFQAMGRATYSMFTSIARQLVVLLPVAFAMAQFGNVNLVWWAYPIAEVMSTIMTAVFLVKLNKEVISKIGH